MINILLSLNTDLASSIAIRYMNELTAHMKILLQDIHVVDPSQKSAEPGTGWVRKTWENAMIEAAKNDIRHFLEVEKLQDKRLKDPKIFIGDRTERILNELQEGDYHLFIEGVIPTFSSSDFYNLLNSRLYRYISCPVLVVKNLIMPDKAALLIEEGTDHRVVVNAVVKFFKDTNIPFDLIYTKYTKSGDAEIKEVDANTSFAETYENAFSEQGIMVNSRKTTEGPAKKIAGKLREYGLVAAALASNPKKNNPMVEILGDVPSPVLICWQ